MWRQFFATKVLEKSLETFWIISLVCLCLNVSHLAVGWCREHPNPHAKPRHAFTGTLRSGRPVERFHPGQLQQ